MKGTLFSADFIEDNNGELRLLEINTDTSTNNLSFLDYTNFIDVLSNNNITKLAVVHKPLLHQQMVNHLSASISVNAPFITSFNEYKEGTNVIYPTTIPDEPNLFILRLAYDEASIFDSEYAKNKLNLLSLFYDANETSSITQFYHSSSLGEFNSITDVANISNLEMNPANIPDAVVKNSIEIHQLPGFYKIGSEVDNESVADKWNNFINQIKNDNILIQRYHVNSESLSDNKVSSIRVYSIVYGSNLDLINLGEYKKFSIFDLPTNLIYNSSSYTNLLDNRHFFEFATNYIKYGGTQLEGILNTHLIIKADDTEIEAGNLVVGDYVKSFYVGGTTLEEDPTLLNSWQLTGSLLPSGSYMTSSVVVYKNTKALDNKTLIKLAVNNNEDSIYVSPLKSFLVHDSIQNKIIWKTAIDINENTDYLLDYDGSTAQVTSIELFVTNDDGFSLIELDVEDTDTYIIAGTTPINSFITHNAPCFVAGTLITLADGSLKKIEDIVAGDIVSTFDLNLGIIVNNKVNNVFSKIVNEVVEYKLENGEVVKCTIDHPIYVVNKGWASFNSELSNGMYSLESDVKSIEVGDVVKLVNGETRILDIIEHKEQTIVYNLQDIENNHNFFANNILVHNRFCFIAGTKITMANGTEKNIEDVIIGDEVLSFNGLENESKKVVDVKTPIHKDLVKYVFSNQKEIICTYDHPFFVAGGDGDLASYAPSLTNSRYNIGKEVRQIKVGDLLFVNESKSQTAIKDIIELDLGDTQTYIFTVEDNHNFYANGILTHNK